MKGKSSLDLYFMEGVAYFSLNNVSNDNKIITIVYKGGIKF